jgi:fibronectin type 3 domain-containing protein
MRPVPPLITLALLLAGLVPAPAHAGPVRAPSTLSATAVSSSAIDLAWDDPNDREAGYQVERGTSATAFQVVASLAPNSTTFRATGLASGTRYYFRVGAVTNGKLPYSPTASATTLDGTPPSVPTGVTAVATTCTSVRVSWNASTDTGGSGLQGYRVYRDGVLWGSVPASTTSTTDTGVAGGTSHAYAVSAIDNGGNESAKSAVASVVTPSCGDAAAPSTPTGVSAVAASCSQVNVSWNASTDTGGSGLKGYNLYRNGAFVKLVLAPATSTSDTGLAGAQAYTYTLVAIDNAGNASAVSAGSTATTPACGDATAPSVPSGVAATATGCSTASLSWNAATDTGGSGLKGYNVYRNGAFLKQVAAPATGTTDSGLAASTTYTYRVSAVDNAGNQSAQSTASSITTSACSTNDTTPPSAPTGVTAMATSCSAITVSWNAATDTGGSGLRGYNVYRNGAFWTEVQAPSTSVTDTGRAALTSYSYIVLAVDNANNGSGLSNTASATTPSCTGTTTSSTTTTSTTTTAASTTSTTKTTTTTTSSTTTTTFADTVAPSVPTGLTGSPVACNQVNLAWNASWDGSGSGVASYLVYRNNSLLKQVAAPATSTADTAVTASTTYSYQVSAVDAAGNQSARSTAFGTTTPVCPIATPALVGFVPGVGAAKAVAIDASTGLVHVASVEFGLATVDVSTPATPHPLGGANPAFNGERVAVAGGWAVVGANAAGLRVVDARYPFAPKTVGALAGTIKGVAIAGSYAYAIQVVPGNPGHTDLIVVDVRVPAAPVVVGRLTIAGGAELAVAGSYAYVAAGSFGLLVVDVSNPLAPRLVGQRDTPGWARVVAVGGNYAYVADDTSVQVIDVGTPSNPVTRASLGITASALAVTGTRLYVLGGDQLQVVDVTSPLAPAFRGAVPAYGAQWVAGSGNVAYLASPSTDVATQAGGLYVVDASTPTSPRVLTNVYGGYENWAVAVAGSRGVVTGNGNGLRVVDLATPTVPRVVGGLTGTMRGAAMGGSYAYAMNVVPGNPAHTDLVTVDLGTPSAPRIVGRLTVAGGTEVAVSGSYAFVPAGAAGLQVIDVSSPTVPRLVGTRDTPGAAVDVAIAGGYAYVADSTTIQVIDVSSPTNPIIRGSLATTATHVAVAGSRLYALGSLQLKTVDVASPTSPRLLSAVDAHAAQAISVRGTMAYLATPAINHMDTTGGVYVMNVAGTTPVLLEQIIVPGATNAVQVVPGSDLVYAGDSAATIDVIDEVP